MQQNVKSSTNSDRIPIFQHLLKFFRATVFIFLDPGLWIHFFWRVQYDLFWSFQWPWMTMIITLLESKYNLESNHMHITCIWSCLRFTTPKWPFLPLRSPRLTLRCTSLNLKPNFRSIHMYITCTWLCFRFLTSKWPF